MEIREYWRVIRRKLLLILIIPIIAVVVSGLYSSTSTTSTPAFTASSTVLLNVGPSTNMPDAATLTGIVDSQVFTKAVIQSASDLSIRAADLASMVTLSMNGDLITFTITSEDKAIAANAANAVAQTFISQGPTIGGLPSARLLDLASPDTASSVVSAKKKSPLIMSAAIGLLIGIGLAFILEYLDMRIKTESDMARSLGITVLGGVEEFSTNKKFKKEKLG